MTFKSPHKFHIPVMGLAYTIDTPLKVARYGISSVLSIVEDFLIERMREIHSKKNDVEYIPIKDNEADARARRTTAYLNLIHDIVEKQIAKLKSESFTLGSDIVKYFELLPESSPLRQDYNAMLKLEGVERDEAQENLRSQIVAGAIDVNIMTKLDKANYDKQKNQLPLEYNDAHAALRGFALSKLSSSMILSAGMNQRLFAYFEQFEDFFPNKLGELKKKVILKVSDFRSSIIQGKILAKKGIWVSEFRIESGLNCGGHAFATDGLLMGPILNEFVSKRDELREELYEIYNNALKAAGKIENDVYPEQRLTVQGGIGNGEEQNFLLQHFNVDATGWGSPFLMVPEASNVESNTLAQLINANKEDYYLSEASPLGVPFNNLRNTSSDKLREERMLKGRPGSACHKKFLQNNTEFTERPICTASRQYMNEKFKQFKAAFTSDEKIQEEMDKVNIKDCLCEGLGASAIINNGEVPAHNLTAISICPGPNLAYFSGIFSLKDMVDHIYGRLNLLNPAVPRPNMFVNELVLYVDYLKKEIDKSLDNMNKKQVKYLDTFKSNLLQGIDYYHNLVPAIYESAGEKAHELTEKMRFELDELQEKIKNFEILVQVPVPA